MNRRRAGLAAALVVVVVLVGAGFVRRAGLIDEAAAAREDRRTARAELRRAQAEIVRVVRRAGAVETATAGTRKNASDLQGVADELATRLAAIGRERDDTVLAAYVANGQLTQLRACLDGVTRALNEVSVGDTHAAGTLGSVRTACEAAGA